MATEQREQRRRSRTDAGPRARLLEDLPVTERRVKAGGFSTAVLEGGVGPPLVLLHGPGAYGAAWLRVIPDLVAGHRVIAPDLPGLGATPAAATSLDLDRVATWLAELIERTSPSPPVLVGHTLGGAIAARFAADHGEQLGGLVLVDALGLRPFEPSPEFGSALMGFLAQPTADNHDGLWQLCSFDLGALHDDLGPRWGAIKAYNVELANTPAVAEAGGRLMELFARPAIPPEVLERIRVPTTLIWGRHDLATPVQVAEEAGKRYGWPLHVIEQAAVDAQIDQPLAFLRALRTALGETDH